MQQDEKKSTNPSRKEQLKPLELIGFSAVLAIFAATIVALATKDFVMLVPIVGISVFIVTLLMVALLGLSMKPNPEDKIMRAEAAKIAAKTAAQITEAAAKDSKTADRKTAENI